MGLSKLKLSEIVETLARISCVGVILLIFVLTADRGIRFDKVTIIGTIMFIFFPIGITAGMIFAWSKPILGGIITIVCAFIYYTLYTISYKTIPLGETFYLFPFPGVIFLISGLLSRSVARQS